MSGPSGRVLLTGAAGFTGRFMRTELEAHGYEVVGLGGGERDGGHVADGISVDLRDGDAVKRAVREVRPDRVVHLAAKAFVGHGSPRDFYDVNLLGTRNLLEALAETDATPDRVLLASSANVYGNASEGMLDESTPPEPANDYAVSKLAMEYAARLWAGRLPLVLVRPFNYTGVGQAENFLIPKIVAHFRRRASVIELGNLDVRRDFSDVRAVVEAYRRLLAAPGAVGKTLNICSGVTCSLRDIIAMCETLTGHRIRVDVNPAFVRENEVKVLFGANTALKQVIGEWSGPTLQQTLEWMLDT